MKRRTFVAGAAAVAALKPASAREGKKTMFGLIGKMIAQPGKRDALTSILIKGVAGMPGCLSYIIAHDPKSADAIWITEVWESTDAHQNSLGLASVKEAIAKGRPLIAGMEQIAETEPVGGSSVALPNR